LTPYNQTQKIFFMKKKIVLLLAFFGMTSLVLKAQGNLATGGLQVNAGLGLSGWGAPVYVGLDYGYSEEITFGGEVSFRTYNERWINERYRHNIIGISGNGNYHFNSLLNLPSEWDLYGGANVGFYVWSSGNNYPGDGRSGLGFGLQAGGRYYFNNKVGLNVELGGSNTFGGGKVGVTIKL
jgi:outer membrane immunogenic protein